MQLIMIDKCLYDRLKPYYNYPYPSILGFHIDIAFY